MHSITQAFSFRLPPKCILVYEQNAGKAEQSEKNKNDHAGQDGSMLPKQSTTFPTNSIESFVDAAREFITEPPSVQLLQQELMAW